MTDKTIDNAKDATIADPNKDQADVSVTKNPEPEHKHRKSAGWRIHNEVTYRGVDWLLNSAVGVAATYWTKRTESGIKYFGKPVTQAFEFVLKPFFKDPVKLSHGAKWGSMFASIMAGGFAIIPVMMLLENKTVKKSAVKGMDTVIYGREATEKDPRLLQTYEDIDKEPKKSFMAGMGSRLVALAPLLVLTVIPTTNDAIKKYLYNPISDASKWTFGKLGIKPKGHLLEGMEVRQGARGDGTPPRFESNWDFLHKTIGFDFGLTIFYSILHEIAYKGMAKNSKKNSHAPTPATNVDIQPPTLISQDIPVEALEPKEQKKRVEPKKREAPVAAENHASAILGQKEQAAALGIGA